MLKRIFTILITLSLFAACGDDTEPPASNNTNNVNPDMEMTDMPVSDTDVPDEDMDVVVPDMDEPDMNEPDMDDADMDDPDMEVPDMAPDMTDEPDMAPFNELQTCLADCAYNGPMADMVDCDYDGLSNAEEIEQLGTDPCEVDSDGDSLSDLDELQAGSDPLLEDSDGDGLEDGREIEFGFDPNNPNSLGDMPPILDGDRWVVNACNNPQAEQVNYYTNNPGDWHLALPPAFNYDLLTVATATGSNKLAAAVFDDPATEVTGFILSRASTATNTPSPVDLVQQINLGAVGSLQQGNTGGEFDTWDFNQASLRRELRRTSQLRSARQVRDQALFAIAPFGPSDVTGLPPSAGNTYNDFRIFVSVTVRPDPIAGDRIITSVALAPAQKFDDREKVRFRIDDLSNTTNVGQAGDEPTVGCTTFRATEGAPAADFYWVMDQSGSMNDDFATLVSVGNTFFSELNNSPLDYRLGVANMDGPTAGRLRVPPAWHTDLPTFIDEINDHVVNCTGCSGSQEFGLEAAQDGITYMRGSSASQVERIRADATLVTIWMSDEDAQSVKDAGGASSSAGSSLVTQYINFFAPQTVGFAIVGIDSACSSDSDLGAAYQAVALGSGGTVASLCDSDLSETIREIIIAASASASNFTLAKTPISSTLRVFKNGEFVPRSRENGFDYFANTNSVAFFGSYRPETPDPVNNFFGDDFAVSYEFFQDRTK